MSRPALAWFSAVAWLATMLPTVPAQAQTTDYAVSAASPEREAEAAYRASLALHESGDLRGALQKMQESHRLSQRAELFYNIARIEGELGDCRASLADYRRYLELVPAGQYRSEAAEASQRLAAECPEPAPVAPVAAAALGPAAETPPPAPASEAPTDERAVGAPADLPSYWTAPRIIGWSAVAAGTVAAAGAVYFAFSARDARDRYQHSIDAAYAVNDQTLIDQGALAEQRADQRWARALGVTGGVLAAGGILLLVLAPSSHSRGATASFSLQPGLVGASYSNVF